MSSDLIAELTGASLAHRTKDEYARISKLFDNWCNEHGLQAWPSDEWTIARYIHSLGTKSLQTMQATVSAIIHGHKQRGFVSPVTERGVVRKSMAGAARRGDVKPQVLPSEAPIRFGDAVAILQHFNGATSSQTLKKLAYLSLGVFLGLRNDSLARLEQRDIVAEEAGLCVRLRRSKSDQVGKGREVWLPHLKGCPAECPACAVIRHLDVLDEARLFTSSSDHAPTSSDGLTRLSGTRWLRKLCAESGVLVGEPISTRSMRSGCATSMYEAGVPEHEIAAFLGHKRVSTTRRYDRRGQAERSHHLDV